MQGDRVGRGDSGVDEFSDDCETGCATNNPSSVRGLASRDQSRIGRGFAKARFRKARHGVYELFVVEKNGCFVDGWFRIPRLVLVYSDDVVEAAPESPRFEQVEHPRKGVPALLQSADGSESLDVLLDVHPDATFTFRRQQKTRGLILADRAGRDSASGGELVNGELVGHDAIVPQLDNHDSYGVYCNDMNENNAIGLALCAALAGAIGQDVTLRNGLQPISGGFWAQIYSFELVDPPEELQGPLVLRVMPDAVAGRREAVVQRWLANSGFATPRVIASGTATGLGEAYMVMQRAAGAPPLAGLKLGPALFGLRRILSTLPALLADAAISLHSREPAPLNDELVMAGLMQASGDAAATFLAAIGRAASSFEPSRLGELGAWFEANRPTSSSNVICHGDLHPFNLLVDDMGGVTVLDWTNATIASREMDIGFTAGLLRCAPIAVPRPIRPIIARITERLASKFIDSYGRRARINARAVAWWEAMQHARCLADLTYGRLNPGSAVGPNHPFETSAPAMQQRLHELTGIAITLPDRIATSATNTMMSA
jgi:aminoglycoside phosphotransferase (APT) family kinase protein